MEISKILEVIRSLAPEELADSWDNSGIQVLGCVSHAPKVAVALDPTPDFVRQALAWGAGMLVTHHPLYFDPVAPVVQGRYLDVLRMLLGQGAWLYGAHTSLDRCPDGPAQWLGHELDLANTRALEPLEEAAPGHAKADAVKYAGAGYGQVGSLPRALSWDEFTGRLERALGVGSWREAGLRPETVSTVAYLPGSGSSAMIDAAAAGADVFITGDLKYHQALETPLCTLDVGHFVIEEEMTRRLALEMDEALDDAEVRHFKGADPFKFRSASR